MKKQMERPIKKKRNLSTLILVLVFFVGLAVLLYPTVSNWWNSRVQTQAIVDYEAALAGMDEADYAAIGGGFPIIVAGTGVVGAVACSGLPHEMDHQLLVDAICQILDVDLDAEM